MRETFRSAAAMLAGGSMLVLAVDRLVRRRCDGPRLHRPTPQAIAVGEEYLHIVAWNFVASGIIFVSSSMFQAMGNTIPSLITSVARDPRVACRSLLLARRQGSTLRWVWYISVAAVFVQLGAEPAAPQARIRPSPELRHRPRGGSLNATDACSLPFRVDH